MSPNGCLGLSWLSYHRQLILKKEGVTRGTYNILEYPDGVVRAGMYVAEEPAGFVCPNRDQPK